MTRIGFTSISFAALLLFGISVGCRAPTPKAVSVVAPEGWRLRFSDTFDRSEPGPDWYLVSGNWRIEDGALAGGSHGAPGYNNVVCTKEFQGDQRLEFYARSDHPCDLTGLLGVSDSGYMGGYFFGFGSDNNAYSKLLIRGRLVMKYDAKIIPGKRHHVVCERVGNQLRHIVDGREVMTFTHEPPLAGPGHEMVGFFIWNTGEIDDVKVYTRATE